MIGAQNKVQFHLITDGTPDTISTTPEFTSTKLISTQTDGHVEKKSVTTKFETDEFSREMHTFMGAAINETEPSDTKAEKYENGNESSAGTASGSSTVRYVQVKYGSTFEGGTHLLLMITVVYVTQASWDHTTKWDTVTKPVFETKSVKQKASNAIALASGVFDSAIVKTTSPTPALPTSILGDTYGHSHEAAVA